VFEDPPPRTSIHVGPGLYLNTAFPNKCRHCNPAPCQEVCPTGAIDRHELDIVTIDGNKCIACAMCAMVCPFDVLAFALSPKVKIPKQVAIKCDHCIDRQKRGQRPACVEACKTGALEFGELNELIGKARSELSKAVSTATTRIQPELRGDDAQLQAWRGWGEAVDRVNRR
jgi:carbon-monoxide dehydrogenase iron sulfur subunit